jgi:hypothetical protein
MTTVNEVVLGRLFQAACDLAQRYSRPVQLGTICNDLGVYVRRTDGRSQRALLVEREDVFEILLPSGMSHDDRFTTWERFLIAHEIGHVFLRRFRVQKPLGKSEYWKMEVICDSFARRLLLPRDAVSKTLEIVGGSASDRLRATLELQRQWDIPWPVAAFEVAECAPCFQFFRISSSNRRFRVSVSTLPNKRQSGRLIDEESSLAVLLRGLKKSSQPVLIPMVTLRSIDGLSEAMDAAVLRATETEYRIAITMRAPN